MFDKLFELFKKDCSMCNLYNLISNLDSIVDLFDEEYLKDKDMRNAAIDCVIQLLEKHKN